MSGETNVYRLCYGQELELNIDKAITYVYFEFPAPGSYREEMERAPGSSAKIEISRRNYKGDSTIHQNCDSWPSATTATYCSVSTSNSGSGSSNYLLIWAATPPYSAKITATRISEGTSYEPVMLPLERREHETWAGVEYSNPEPYRGGSSNNLNHYLFWLSSPAEGKRLVIDRFGSSCEGYGSMHFHLTNVSTKQIIAGLQSPDSDCNLSYEFKAGESGLYYLRVRQGRGLVSQVPKDTSATRSFRIRLE